MRWNLVDRFEVLQRGRYSRARKSFRGPEDFFVGHFPAKPLVPSTLLIEMVAQAGGVLYGLGFDFKKEVILAKVVCASFPRQVSPPCEFLIEATIDKEHEEGAWVSGTVKEKDVVVAEVQILLVTMEILENNHKDSVVFNKNFLSHYDIYGIVKTSEALR